jgi:hypothetical protein
LTTIDFDEFQIKQVFCGKVFEKIKKLRKFDSTAEIIEPSKELKEYIEYLT